MTLKLIILFFTPLISGLMVYLVPSAKGSNFKLLLVFAGSYLFAITVTHILPELYRQNAELELIALCNYWNILLQVLSTAIYIHTTTTITSIHIHISLFPPWYYYPHCVFTRSLKEACLRSRLRWAWDMT